MAQVGRVFIICPQLHAGVLASVHMSLCMSRPIDQRDIVGRADRLPARQRARFDVGRIVALPVGNLREGEKYQLGVRQSGP